MSINELSTSARTYRELQAEIRALQEQADAVKQAIIAEMDARKAESVQAGEYTIRYAAYQTTRIDTARIKADGLYAQYSASSTALRFTVA